MSLQEKETSKKLNLLKSFLYTAQTNNSNWLYKKPSFILSVQKFLFKNLFTSKFFFNTKSKSRLKHNLQKIFSRSPFSNIILELSSHQRFHKILQHQMFTRLRNSHDLESFLLFMQDQLGLLISALFLRQCSKLFPRKPFL